MAQSHRGASRRLFEIAEQQQGFFTTQQAKAAGFAEKYALELRFKAARSTVDIDLTVQRVAASADDD